VRDLQAMKEKGERIVVLTAYDALMARLVSAAGVDVILVGDSLGQVVLGHDSTLPVTLDDMIRHAGAVCRGAPDAFVVVDLPFLTYQVDEDEAVRNAGRVLQETGARAVKVEGGGGRVRSLVARLVETGIPVMGHVGLTPQSVHALGGYRVQGREEEAARRLRSEARELAAAGAFAVVLELLPADLAREITGEIPVPTIGIGAGAACDGQVLVVTDALGLDPDFEPRFVRRYAQLHRTVVEALSRYAEEVRGGRFPAAGHAFDTSPADGSDGQGGGGAGGGAA
jgi:3-methyl-2-oxobutanoate hydroxymethyltransferase